MSESNIDFSDVFGPIDEGVNSDEGVQEPTEPANDDGMTEGSVEDNTEGSKEQEPAEPVKNQQSAAENAKYAAARREAERERDEAIARMRAEQAAELDKVISGLGLENPYTGKAVSNREELEAYKEQHAKEMQKQMQERAEEAGLSDEEIQNLVKSHPDFQQAMQIVHEAKAAKEAAERERAQNTLDAAIKEVHELDSSINSMDDLRQHDSWSEVENRVRRGYTFADAFYMANRTAIEQRKMAALEQQIRNSMNGKGHLDSSSPKGDGGITVPSDVMAEYRLLNPNATDEQIMRHYAKDIQRKKK